jgi:hypothetical protein
MDDVDKLDKEKCQSLYMNLLACQSLNRIPDSVYVREFFETRRCDHVKSFEGCREDYANRINKGDPERLQRVLKFEETRTDERIVAQARLHYAQWHYKQLVGALSAWNSFAYHLSVEQDRGRRVETASWRPVSSTGLGRSN